MPGKWTDNFFRKDENLLIACILIFAAIIRLYAGHELSLSNDELSALTRAKANSFHDLIVNGVYIDYHPAGVEIFIYYWLKIFGESAFLFRIPFILTGVGSVWLIYILGKKWFSTFTGLLAAAIFAGTKFCILYSMYARLYSPGLFFSLLTTLVWTNIVFPDSTYKNKEIRRSQWVWLVVLMSVCTHIHYFSFVFVAGLGLTGLFFISKNNRLPYLISGMIVLALFTPEWQIFLEQMKTGDIGGWLAPPEKSFLLDFVHQLLNKSALLNFIVAILVIPGLFFLLKSKLWRKFHSISLAWVLFSFLIAYGYSVLRGPVLQYSTLFFVLPFLLFLIANVIQKIVIQKLRSAFILLMLFGTCWSTIVEAKLFTRPTYGLFREPAQDLQRWISKYGKDQVPCVVNAINTDYLRYYFRQLNFDPWLVADKVNSGKRFSSLANILDTLQTDYFAFTWSNCENIFEVNKLIQDKYPYLVEKNIYFNSGTYLYSRKNSSGEISTIFQTCCDFDSVACVGSDLKLTETYKYSGKKSAIIDSSAPYALTYQKYGRDLPGTGYRWMNCSFRLLSQGGPLSALMVMEVNRNKENLSYFTSDIGEFELESGSWNKVTFSRLLPDDLQADDEIKMYIWNKDQQSFFVDDFCISIDTGDDPYLE